MPSTKLLNKRTNSKVLILAVLVLFLFQPLLIMPVARAEESGQETESGTEDPGDTGPTTATVPATDDDGDSSYLSNDNEASVDNDVSGVGDTGQNEIGQSPGDAEIDTGEADVESEVSNALSEDECDDNGQIASTVKEICLENDNEAEVDNEVTLGGNTGENEINESGGEATIKTGDISIISIIINFINNNFFGQGREFFINIFNQLVGTIDLSGYNEDQAMGAESSGECTTGPCFITLNNSSSAEVTNDVTIEANSGSNTIGSSGGASLIETGDITIFNNLLNMVNLNLAGEDWFFAVVNVFGELEGDIVLPGMAGEVTEAEAEELFEQVEQMDVPASEIIITNSSFANVINNMDVLANTGANDIVDSSGQATINTGDIISNLSSFNFINCNLYGNTWKFTRVNVFGNWQGLIHGLPEGYDYFADENGVTIYNDFLNQSLFGETYAKLMVNNNNTAAITNNVAITANSGDNAILHSQGDSTINTGDIIVHSSLVNFINSNFIGNDWEFSMINVFGDWQGNLAFGQPELWITESISPHHNPLKRGHFVTYNFLFGNNGDGLATGVKIIDDFNETFFNVAEAGDGAENGGNVLFDLGQLPPNSQGSISYTVQVKDKIPYGKNQSPNTVTIVSDGNDRDYNNNSSGGTVTVDGGRSKKDRFKIAMSSGLPNLMIVKTNDAEEVVHHGDRVNYQIIIKNTGSVPLYDVLVVDVMTDESGENELNRNFWDLETVYNGEEIVIDYTLEINGNLTNGTYINEAIVEGFDQETEMYMSAVASSKIKVENTGNEEVVVLGEEGTPQLVVGKIIRERFAYPGDEVLYKLIITNNGDLTAFGVSLTESLANGLTFSGGQETVRQWEVGDIEPGEFISTEYLVKVDDSLAPGIYTSATVVKAANSGPAVSNADLEVRAKEAMIGEEAKPTPIVSGAGAGSDYDGQGFYKSPIQVKTAMAAVSEPLISQLDLGIKAAAQALVSEDIPAVMTRPDLEDLLIVLVILLAFFFLMSFLKRRYIL
jgi:uncharacterized repeat protein (TIGR01451 family)